MMPVSASSQHPCGRCQQPTELSAFGAGLAKQRLRLGASFAVRTRSLTFAAWPNGHRIAPEDRSAFLPYGGTA